jgi:hypothetical protein
LMNYLNRRFLAGVIDFMISAFVFHSIIACVAICSCFSLLGSVPAL